jgi:ABC-type methionine transport system permease subunit
MFEVFGFWVAVSIVCFFLLAFPMLVLVELAKLMLSQAVGKRKSRSARQWLSKYNYDHSHCKVLGVVVHDFIMLISWIGSLLFGIICITVLANKGVTVIDFITITATSLTPVAIWVGIIGIVYFGGVYAIRYGYKAYEFSVSVKEHVENKDMHK